MHDVHRQDDDDFYDREPPAMEPSPERWRTEACWNSLQGLVAIPLRLRGVLQRRQS